MFQCWLMGLSGRRLHTGLQLKLFPTVRRSALLRPPDYSTCARKTYFQQKAWVMLFTFLTVHVSRVTLEGRHNALKNGSSSTFLRAWSKQLTLKRRNRRTRGRRRGRRKKEEDNRESRQCWCRGRESRKERDIDNWTRQWQRMRKWCEPAGPEGCEIGQWNNPSLERLPANAGMWFVGQVLHHGLRSLTFSQSIWVRGFSTGLGATFTLRDRHCTARDRGRIRFVPSAPAPPDPEPRSLRSSSEKCAAKANEKSWLGSDNYQATCHGIKLESGDLQRFFMIDEIDHVSKKKSHPTVCVCAGRGRSCSGFLRGCLSPKLLWPWAENENAETTWRLSLFVWRGGMGAWTSYGDCARQVNALSRCFPLRRNEQSVKEVEQMRQAEVVETNRLGQANMTK